MMDELCVSHSIGEIMQNGVDMSCDGGLGREVGASANDGGLISLGRWQWRARRPPTRCRTTWSLQVCEGDSCRRALPEMAMHERERRPSGS
mmetsp:Transcript_103248/g.331073  ORF Transcript_103248/g.331073 Transcript_103248/m.331073 type:complete len:91 (+) Transcript_103248:134-406(+)